MLKINQLSKSIHHKKILDDLSFEIQSSQIGIFLGGSGVGKSTLLRVLNNLESYDSGSFTWEGSPLNIRTSAHIFGMVFQHFNLFEHLNAEDNIILTLTKCKGLSRQDAQKLTDQLLERYELKNHAKSRISHLSGGQKQRLAIARTIAVDPKIICMDEPTSALDPRLTMQVAKFITELASENRIVLLTTHDMNLVHQLKGHLFLMQAGKIVENAAKEHCLSNPQAFPKIHEFLKGE